MRYPDLSVELIMRDSVGDLVADGFDLALRFGEPPVGSFVARKLIETRVLTVASPSYIKAHGKPRHPKKIEERDCIESFDQPRLRSQACSIRGIIRPHQLLDQRFGLSMVRIIFNNEQCGFHYTVFASTLSYSS